MICVTGFDEGINVQTLGGGIVVERLVKGNASQGAMSDEADSTVEEESGGTEPWGREQGTQKKSDVRP